MFVIFESARCNYNLVIFQMLLVLLQETSEGGEGSLLHDPGGEGPPGGAAGEELSLRQRTLQLSDQQVFPFQTCCCEAQENRERWQPST